MMLSEVLAVSNTTNSLRSALSFPSVYRFFTCMIGANKFRQMYVARYVRPKSGDSVLDIGCGPADILEHLPDVRYVGFDSNFNYIESAKKRFNTRGTFFCDRVSEATISEYQSFDLVLANGILHHLDDSEAIELFVLAHNALKAGGRLITLDGCYTPTQSKVSRYLLGIDRGKYVRTEDAYGKLASKVFSEINVTLQEKLLRIPYTHIILECKK